MQFLLLTEPVSVVEVLGRVIVTTSLVLTVLIVEVFCKGSEGVHRLCRVSVEFIHCTGSLLLW